MTRRRPFLLTGATPGRCRGGLVELHVTATELEELVADPGRHRAWAGVIADLAAQYARRDLLLVGLDAPAER